MTSRTPPASPALTMLTYRREKYLGCADNDSARDLPALICFKTSWITFRSAGLDANSAAIVKLRSRGNPACTRVESSSVKNRSEEHTSELQSQSNIVCRLLLE